MQKVASIVLLLMSLGIFYLMILRIDNEKTCAYDLHPGPDAREYFAAALSLAEDKTYQIHVAGQSLPPRYPFGYSLLMAPMMRLGLDPVEAPFAVNRILALGILLGLFVSLWVYGQYVAAGLASLILATLPAFIVLARSPMSEIAGTFVFLIGLIAVVRYATHHSLWWGSLGGFILGLSVWVRLLNLPLGIFVVILVPLFRSSASLRRRLIDAGLFLLTFLIALTPLLMYQYRVFGSPFWTGYHFWTDLGKRVTLVFHPKFLNPNLDYLLREVLQQENQYTVANIYGEGSYFGPALVILLLLVVYRFKRHRIFYVLAIPSLIYCLALLFYQFREARFFFPVMVMGVGGISLAWVSALRTTKWPGRALLFLVLLCQLSMFPGRKIDPEFERYVRAKALYEGTAVNYSLMQTFNKIRGSGRAFILTDMDPPFAYALTNEERMVVPITVTHDYRFARDVDFSRKTFRKQFDQAVLERWRVYAVVSTIPVDSIEKQWPAPKGWSWELLLRDERTRGAVMELRRA